MKNTLPMLAISLALLSLSGCGLKGPLYFPPTDKTSSPPAPTQDSTPDRNSRGDSSEVSQVNG